MPNTKKHGVIYALDVAVVLTHPAMYSEEKGAAHMCVRRVCVDGWMP